MGRNDSAKPIYSFFNIARAAFFALGIAVMSSAAVAADLPLAAGSPLVGFTFEDRPLLLPVQRNFQMAMLTASSELRRSCGKMESYGWRMNQSEQQRVNQIFNDTVDRLRGLGYSVEAQAPASVSNDVTIFTADRPNRHFIFMWSAGEIGLVMALCESSPPPAGSTTAMHAPSVETFPQTAAVSKSPIKTPVRGKSGKAAAFSPVGNWVGNYTCAQGYTGGTLRITSLKGENFQGLFRFYPTVKNPHVPPGRYTVYGQYDQESKRILINPGKWLERPKHYENTIIVGSFDPIARTFSAYFQGIVGCTSFEAKYSAKDDAGLPVKSAHKAVKKKRKKKTPAKPKAAQEKEPEKTSTATEVPAATPAAAGPAVTPSAAAPGTAAPNANPPAATAAAPAAPAAPGPVTPAPALAPAPAPSSPSSIVLPAPSSMPSPSSAAPAAPSPPIAPAPASPPPATSPAAPSATSPTNSPAAPPPASAAPTPPAPGQAPAPSPTPKPSSGSIAPRFPSKIVLADASDAVGTSGAWFTPTVPQVAPAPSFTPTVPVITPAPTLSPPEQAPQTVAVTPAVPQLSPPPIAPQAEIYPTAVPVVQPAGIVPSVTQAPEAERITPYVPQVPPAEKVPDYRP